MAAVTAAPTVARAAVDVRQGGPGASRTSRGRLDPLLTGLAAALVAGVDVTVPALWRDEAASVTAALRSWSALAGTVAHVDVVHAGYYALLHVWFAVVGYSPLTLRLPSVVAVGGTAAVLTVLGSRLAGRRAGLAAGIAAAVLPSLVWAGGEGRSYAGTALVASAAALALVHALAPHRDRRAAACAWVGHAALLALGSALFLDAVLLVPAHLLTALLLGRGRRRGAALASCAAAVVAVAPLIVLASRQTAQVGWIPHYAPASPWHQLAVEQWFRSDAAAIAAAVVLGVGALASVLRRRTNGAALAVALPWALLPPAVLLAAGLVRAPLYWPRYVLFSAPAVALLIGLAVAALPRLLAVAALTVLAVAAAPQIVADRQPRAKAQSELGLAAALVGHERRATDGAAGIVFGDYDDIAGLTTRISAIAYPQAYRGLADLRLRTPLDRSTSLFGANASAAAGVPRTAPLRTVWILLDADASPQTRVPAAVMRALGFHETGRFTTPGSVLLRWSR